MEQGEQQGSEASEMNEQQARRRAKRAAADEEDRAKREYTLSMSKRALIDLCQAEASKFLVAGRYVQLGVGVRLFNRGLKLRSGLGLGLESGSGSGLG